MAVEYFSFEKVLKELQMDEDELKRLVSEGQIRAFRDEDKMKFRRDDIEGLKKGRQTEPTIILPPGEEQRSGEDIMVVDDDTDETLLDLEDLGGEEIGESDETSIPALDLKDDEAGGETVTEELVFDDDLGLDGGDETDEIATQETFIDQDDEVGMTTEPLDLGDEDEEEDAKPKTVIATRRAAAATSRAPRSSGRASAAAMVEEEPDTVSPMMLILTVAGAAILLYVGLFLIDVARGSFTSLTGGVAAMMQSTFSKDTEGEPTWNKPGAAGKADKGGQEDSGKEGEGEGDSESE